jgi:asparagine synthase (glutamine-hydrolysing)
MCHNTSIVKPKSLEFISARNVVIGLVKENEDDQIFSDEKKSLYVCVEGEIYEIDKEEHGSAAMAIAHMYKQYGLYFVRRLHGSYIIVIFDEQKGKLWIFRDKIGERPLFYSIVDDNLLFASEIKSILQFEEMEKEIAQASINYFLKYSYVPAPLTIFKDIQKLCPSSIIEYDVTNKTFKIRDYWDPSLKVDHSLEEDSWTEIIYRKLVASTKIRLQRCKSPLGVMLSGGIDSSIVSAMLRRLTPANARIMAFTSGFLETEYDETAYARKVAETLDLDHHIQFFEPNQIPKFLPKLAWSLEEPFGGNAIAHFLNFDFARKFTDSVFNGDGGDEAFYYPFFQEPRYLKYCQKFPYIEKMLSLSIVRRIIRKAINIDYVGSEIGIMDIMESLISERIAFFPFQPLELKENLRKFRQIEIPHFVRKYVERALDLQAEDFPSILSYVCFRTRLPDCMIRMTSCTSSLAEINVKSPFLDTEIMNMAFSIPSNLKLRNGKAKYILIRTANKFNLLPKEIMRREKAGFPVPFEQWLRKDLKYLIQHMAESDAIKKYLNLNYVNKMVRMFERSEKSKARYPYSYYLWDLIMFWKWHQVYMENDAGNFHS